MRDPIGELCKLAGHCRARVRIQSDSFRIRVEIKSPQTHDNRDCRDAPPDWPPIRLHVKCTPSSQQRSFRTMPRSRKTEAKPVNRRGFLKGAAAGAAALVATPAIGKSAVQAQAARPT